MGMRNKKGLDPYDSETDPNAPTIPENIGQSSIGQQPGAVDNSPDADNMPSVNNQPMTTQGVVSNQPIDIEGQLPQQPTQQAVGKGQDIEAPDHANENTFSDQDKAAASRFIAGATPALLGLLFGATPTTAANQVAQGQNFYQGGTPKNLAMTIDPATGRPIYQSTANAVGNEPFMKPVKQLAQNEKVSFTDPSNPGNPGTVFQGSFNKFTGQYLDAAGVPHPNAKLYTPAVFQNATGPQGQPTVTPMSSVTGQPIAQPTQLQPGEAQQAGMGAQQYAAGVGAATKFTDTTAANRQIIQQSESARSNILNPNPRVQMMGINNAQAILTNVASNPDSKASLPEGFVDKMTEMATRMIKGQAGPDERAAFAQGMQQVEQAQQKIIAGQAGAVSQSVSGGQQPAQSFMQSRLNVPAPVNVQQAQLSATNHPESSQAIQWANANLGNKTMMTNENGDQETTDSFAQRMIDRNRNATLSGPQ